MSTQKPVWFKDAIFYQIYPQTFYDTNNDGIGDIRGIIEKLDYIKSLGVNAIWLNPCFESPFRDAGYDIADFYQVAKRYGTNDDLKELFNKAHERDIRVLLDLVQVIHQLSANGLRNHRHMQKVSMMIGIFGQKTLLQILPKCVSLEAIANEMVSILLISFIASPR